MLTTNRHCLCRRRPFPDRYVHGSLSACISHSPCMRDVAFVLVHGLQSDEMSDFTIASYFSRAHHLRHARTAYTLRHPQPSALRPRHPHYTRWHIARHDSSPQHYDHSQRRRRVVTTTKTLTRLQCHYTCVPYALRVLPALHHSACSPILLCCL